MLEIVMVLSFIFKVVVMCGMELYTAETTRRSFTYESPSGAGTLRERSCEKTFIIDVVVSVRRSIHL